MKKEITFVLTSCGRIDLLDETLKSFFKHNSYKCKEYFLVEDSVNKEVYKHIKKKWDKKLDLIFNKEKQGQITSIVNTYQKVKTPYIFHCEDDWVYTRNKFIEDSFKIMSTDEKIIQVWLESMESASRLDVFEYGPLQKIGNIGYRKVFCKEGWEWGYFSFRPGVKRMTDYELIGGYSGYKNELDIGVTYKKKGFYTVIIEKPAVIDIGLDRTILDPTRKWPKRRKTNAPTGLKRLWKHIKKLKF